jgi:hypothetical protein
MLAFVFLLLFRGLVGVGGKRLKAGGRTAMSEGTTEPVNFLTDGPCSQDLAAASATTAKEEVLSNAVDSTGPVK